MKEAIKPEGLEIKPYHVDPNTKEIPKGFFETPSSNTPPWMSRSESKTDAAQERAEKKGGSYAEVKETSDENHEVHHMPAKSASELPENDGPAIKMEKADHRQTASCGNSKEAQEYRQKQKELIEQGKFREAFQMDIDDIREKFGDKYDEAIAEVEEYLKKLEEEGRV